jgi:hypothetical protein
MNLLTVRCKEVFAFAQVRDDWISCGDQEVGFSRADRNRARDCGLHAANRNCGAHRKCARLELEDWNSKDSRASCSVHQKLAALMKKKSAHPDFDQTLELLRAHSFDVTPYAGVAGGVLVSKHGVGAVLAPPRPSDDPEEAAAAYAVRPGILVRGEVSLLLDRGYQKFIKTSQYELPATATQLQAIHAFSEELTQLIGAISLYNESLGTTSDVYRYDRLMGREVEDAAPAQPWELSDGH